MSRIVQISSSEDESTEQLANLILVDVALTQKIIRLANSVTFRSSSNQIVTSVTRAIQLLGLDTIKACALAMILVDGMPGKHAKCVRQELMLALSASLIGRQMAKRSFFPNAEEVAIAALFRNMGRLLLAAFDHKLYRETINLINQGTHTHAKASIQTLGCSFDTLTEIAMRQWLIPDSIINAMKLIPTSALKPPRNRQEWMQQVTEFSVSSAQLIFDHGESTECSLDVSILDRFGVALNMDKTQLDALIVQAAEETRVLSNQASLQSLVLAKESDMEDQDSPSVSDSPDDLLNGLIFKPSDAEDLSLNTQRHASGKPYNALDQLLAGVLNVTKMTATRQYKSNELMLLVLETLHKSLGFSFAAICLRDTKTHKYRARQSLGRDNHSLQRHFIFPDTPASDLFSLAIKRNIDLFISNAIDTKIQSMLPGWYLELFPDTKSFIILPMTMKGKSIGFFYLDRQQEAPEGISTDEMKIIKTLKKQILSSLNV